MSVVNEINAHFNGLHRDLKELSSQLSYLSVELQDKSFVSPPEMSSMAPGLLPSIASRQMDLNKVITHLTAQVKLLREVVNPHTPANKVVMPRVPLSQTDLEDASVNAMAKALAPKEPA